MDDITNEGCFKSLYGPVRLRKVVLRWWIPSHPGISAHVCMCGFDESYRPVRLEDESLDTHPPVIHHKKIVVTPWIPLHGSVHPLDTPAWISPPLGYPCRG